MGRIRKRGLSPLVSTMILISAAIVGGMFVYNYFQTSVNKIMATSQSLTVNVKTIPTDNGSLVYLSVTNVGKDAVQLEKAVFLGSNGTKLAPQPDINTQLRPGGKNTFIISAPTGSSFIYLVYKDGETELQTDPIQLS